MYEDGRRKAEMAQDHETIADWNENRDGVENRGGAQVSSQEKCQYYNTRENVANAFYPHKGKGRGIVDRDAEAG